MAASAPPGPQSADEKRLAELGYKQELDRSWSGFSNFAISFSIISILAGCFTTLGQAWDHGGPIAISIGWPLISVFILIIGLCLSELVSAYPTAGGIYWWAAKMGKPVHGWYTGWFNLIGLVAVVASVDYGCATFASFTISIFDSGWDPTDLTNIFIIFLVVLVLHGLLNVFGSHLMALLNNVSVYWHVAGATIVVLLLLFGTDDHADLGWIFSGRINNSGFADGSTDSLGFWFIVVPMGFLLTQYTITGFDACAHISEETNDASTSAAKGIWRSIAYSAIGGWLLLLAFLWAAPEAKVDEITETAGGFLFYYAPAIFVTSLSVTLVKIIMLITTVGQFFCGMSCVTSASRMLWAFSRDRAVPGHQAWATVNHNRVPVKAVMGIIAAALVLTVPALWKSDFGTPTAFLAIVSVAVLGLYVAFAIPIWLRLRMGDSFIPGPWTLGPKYRWMCWVAVIEIAIVSVYFMLPFYKGGVPGDEDFTWLLVNYAPIVMVVIIGSITIWWHASAKNWFKGPIRTVDEPEPATREPF
jgi:amino acid transporter